jgi:hypothetical protein
MDYDHSERKFIKKERNRAKKWPDKNSKIG